MKTSIKQLILTHLRNLNSFEYGGSIERHIGAIAKCKESNVGRRLRELENENKVERQLVKINGKGIDVVQYKIAEFVDQSFYRPEYESETIPVNSPLSQAILL